MLAEYSNNDGNLKPECCAVKGVKEFIKSAFYL